MCLQVADILPSQIMWINIPSISMLHWHPVSVADVALDTSSGSSGTITVHFKAYGSWTKVTAHPTCNLDG